MYDPADVDNRANSVDGHVGARVRLRRKALGLSQQVLADELALTFQQVQKYERGTNRISASKLYEISRTLGVPVAFFFEGLAAKDADETADAGAQLPVDLVNTPGGIELASAFLRLPNRARSPLVAFVKDLADDLRESDERPPRAVTRD